MTNKDISTLIESEREQLTEGRDDISDAVTLRPDPYHGRKRASRAGTRPGGTSLV